MKPSPMFTLVISPCTVPTSHHSHSNETKLMSGLQGQQGFWIHTSSFDKGLLNNILRSLALHSNLLLFFGHSLVRQWPEIQKEKRRTFSMSSMQGCRSSPKSMNVHWIPSFWYSSCLWKKGWIKTSQHLRKQISSSGAIFKTIEIWLLLNKAQFEVTNTHPPLMTYIPFAWQIITIHGGDFSWVFWINSSFARRFISQHWETEVFRNNSEAENKVVTAKRKHELQTDCILLVRPSEAIHLRLGWRENRKIFLAAYYNQPSHWIWQRLTH